MLLLLTLSAFAQSTPVELRAADVTAVLEDLTQDDDVTALARRLVEQPPGSCRARDKFGNRVEKAFPVGFERPVN